MSLKRLFGAFTKVEKQDDGTLYVEGVASSEARDADGEIITADAMKKAIPGFLRADGTGPIREMHQLKAAGKTLEVWIDKEKKTRFSALVVDSEAVKKVETGVYQGFSVGGKATGRSAEDPTVITELKWVELSLVDRGANPDAVVTLWKADSMDKNQRPFVQLSDLFAKFKKGSMSIDDAEKQALEIAKAGEPAPVAKAALTGAAKIAADARACAAMCIECAKSCIDGAATTEWHGYSCQDAVSACVSCARYCLACAEALDVEASEKAATSELKKAFDAITGPAEQLIAKAAKPATPAAPPPAAPKEQPVTTPAVPAAPQSDVEKALEKVKAELEEKLEKARKEREQSAAAQTAGHEALKKSLELQEQIRKQKQDDEAQAKQVADAIAELHKKYDAEIQKVAAETKQLSEIASSATAQAQKTNALNEQLLQELAKRPKGALRAVPVEKAADNGTKPDTKEPADPKDPVALVKAVHSNGPSIDLTARIASTRRE